MGDRQRVLRLSVAQTRYQTGTLSLEYSLLRPAPSTLAHAEIQAERDPMRQPARHVPVRAFVHSPAPGADVVMEMDCVAVSFNNRCVEIGVPMHLGLTARCVVWASAVRRRDPVEDRRRAG